MKTIDSSQVNTQCSQVDDDIYKNQTTNDFSLTLKNYVFNNLNEIL